MSFGEWVAGFGALDVPDDACGLTDAVAHFDRYTAKLASAVALFDASGQWDLDGSNSAVTWLRDRGMTRPDAFALVRLGKSLHAFPVTSAAWIAGALSGGQVKVICAHVPFRHTDLFASHEAELVTTFAGLSVDDTAIAMRIWRAKADALNDGPEPREEPCEAFLSPGLDDRGVLSASLDAEGYALAQAALELADGAVLDYGRATKTPSPDLYNAVVVRDQHCRWPGCDRPPSWCHAHHVKWWGTRPGQHVDQQPRAVVCEASRQSSPQGLESPLVLDR